MTGIEEMTGGLGDYRGTDGPTDGLTNLPVGRLFSDRLKLWIVV